MRLACLPSVVAVSAGIALSAAAADQRQPLLPPGGHFQSIAYEAERAAPDTSQAETPRGAAKPRVAATAAQPEQGARPRRHPVPAAAIAEPAPAGSAAARAKELER